MPSLRTYVPYAILSISISLIMVGAYADIGFGSSGSPKAIWSANPVSITFSGSAGKGSSGSVSDSFKCAPPVKSIVLTTAVGSSKIELMAEAPSGQISCGPSFGTLMITAMCIVTACAGSYTGTVTIHMMNQYGNIVPPGLIVGIVID